MCVLVLFRLCAPLCHACSNLQVKFAMVSEYDLMSCSEYAANTKILSGHGKSELMTFSCLCYLHACSSNGTLYLALLTQCQ